MGPKKKKSGLGETGSIGNTMIQKLNITRWHKEAISMEAAVRNLVFM
jgi:hypothetical protein